MAEKCRIEPFGLLGGDLEHVRYQQRFRGGVALRVRAQLLEHDAFVGRVLIDQH